MGEFVEKEIKTGLSQTEYHALYTFFECAQRIKIIQENFYFDTQQFDLQHQQLGLRIRLDQQQGEYTLKEPLNTYEKVETNDYFSLKEARHYLNSQTFPIGQVAKKLATYHIEQSQLVQIGFLKNERYEIETPTGLWVLDKSYFPSGISYELEFEYIESTTPFFEFLATQHISFKAIPSKLARAISTH